MANTNADYARIAPEDAALAARLALERFPRAAAYNPRWALAHHMGPNVLWLTEALTQVMDLRAGMRVLDMGCGKAISSLFLAREFGVQVWAADLWISPTENWRRIREAGAEDRVFPIHAEAHALPFAEGYFDALISLDAYHYFGTDDLYLASYARFVKEGGQIGIVVPGLRDEFPGGVPAHLTPYWQAEFSSFHSPAWWGRHWEKSGAMTVPVADFLPGGGEQWLLWQEVCLEHGAVPDSFREWAAQEAEMLRADGGKTLGFSRVVARRKDSSQPRAEL